MTRQVRLSTAEQIQKRLKEFTGKKINIVLRDRKVLFGELRTFESGQVTFLNMRQQPVKLLLADISEIYFDFKE